MEDVNTLIALANQMGLVHGYFDKAVPNATKCSTWEDIQASHRAVGLQVMELERIYGMLAFLGIGLGASLITFLGEASMLCLSGSTSVRRLAWRG